MTLMKRVLLVTIIILIMAAGFIIWDMGLLQNSAQNPDDLYIGANDATAQNTGKTSGQTGESGYDSAVFGNQGESIEANWPADNDSNARTIIRSKPIAVAGNTPEYELQASLCEADDSKLFIRIEYFINGMSVVNELDEKQVPEISGILESTSSQHDDINTEGIQQLLLNPMYGQLYMLIGSKPGAKDSQNSFQTSFYKINLSDMAVERLFSYQATYGKMVFNKDYSLLAYSFKDLPQMSTYQEDSMLSVYDCKAGKYIIKANRDTDLRLIGTNSSPGFLYDYEFVSWNSLNTLRLRQGTRKMTDLDKAPVQIEVLYDIKENVLLDLDGSMLKQVSAQDAANGTEGTDSEVIEHQDAENADIDTENSSGMTDNSDKGVSDSESVKVLKNFYSYLQSKDDYSKAMDLLDDNFKLRMAMLRQFGVQDISKSDIDAGYDQENVSLYSDLLKAARLDTIAKETTIKEDTVVIAYYHFLGISADSQVRQPMSARIVKRQNGWKIVLIEDGVQ